MLLFFFFKQKTAYEMRISDWSSDVCSSDLLPALGASGDVTRSRTPGSTIGIPEAGAITDTRYAIGVGVTGFELDFWVGVRTLSEAARWKYLATVKADRGFRLALFGDVASPYLVSGEADDRIGQMGRATAGPPVPHGHPVAGLLLE